MYSMQVRYTHPKSTSSLRERVRREHYAGPQTLWIDLLNPELEDLLTRNPNQLLAEIEGFRGDLKWVVIDEVQRCPKLLNLVHQQIEKRNLKFALTGSSARRLKQSSGSEN